MEEPLDYTDRKKWPDRALLERSLRLTALKDVQYYTEERRTQIGRELSILLLEVQQRDAEQMLGPEIEQLP